MIAAWHGDTWAVSILTDFARLNDHKVGFQRKHRHLLSMRCILCCVPYPAHLHRIVLLKADWSCNFQNPALLPRGWRFWNLTGTIPKDQLKAAASVSAPLRDPEEWAKMIWDHVPDLITFWTTSSRKAWLYRIWNVGSLLKMIFDELQLCFHATVWCRVKEKKKGKNLF